MFLGYENTAHVVIFFHFASFLVHFFQIVVFQSTLTRRLPGKADDEGDELRVTSLQMQMLQDSEQS